MNSSKKIENTRAYKYHENPINTFLNVSMLFMCIVTHISINKIRMWAGGFKTRFCKS